MAACDGLSGGESTHPKSTFNSGVSSTSGSFESPLKIWSAICSGVNSLLSQNKAKSGESGPKHSAIAASRLVRCCVLADVAILGGVSRIASLCRRLAFNGREGNRRRCGMVGPKVIGHIVNVQVNIERHSRFN